MQRFALPIYSDYHTGGYVNNRVHGFHMSLDRTQEIISSWLPLAPIHAVEALRVVRKAALPPDNKCRV